MVIVKWFVYISFPQGPNKISLFFTNRTDVDAVVDEISRKEPLITPSKTEQVRKLVTSKCLCSIRIFMLHLEVEEVQRNTKNHCKNKPVRVKIQMPSNEVALLYSWFTKSVLIILFYFVYSSRITRETVTTRWPHILSVQGMQFSLISMHHTFLQGSYLKTTSFVLRPNVVTHYLLMEAKL